MNKEQLRREILARRRAVSSSLSAAICRHVARLPVFCKASTIMLYFSAHSEVDTSLLFTLSEKAGKKICAPRVLNETAMEAAYVDEGPLQKGKFGIWEPCGKVAEDIDLVIVPGVVFDRQGHRIGYGKGYYDRFLQGRKVSTVGLAYACQVVPEIPAEPHDVTLDMIVTEEGILP